MSIYILLLYFVTSMYTVGKDQKYLYFAYSLSLWVICLQLHSLASVFCLLIHPALYVYVQSYLVIIHFNASTEAAAHCWGTKNVIACFWQIQVFITQESYNFFAVWKQGGLILGQCLIYHKSKRARVRISFNILSWAICDLFIPTEVHWLLAESSCSILRALYMQYYIYIWTVINLIFFKVF